MSYNTAAGHVSIGQRAATTAAPQFAGFSPSVHVIPTTDVTYNLRSSTKRFRDLYLSGSTIYVGDVVISFDSTSNSFQFKSELEPDITVTQSSLTFSTASTSANQIADTTDASQARTVKYLVQAANGNNF